MHRGHVCRVRMQSMEHQLAGLSTLVHTALMSKGTSEAVFKDIEMLRREILGNGRAGPSDIDTSSEAGSVSRFSGRFAFFHLHTHTHTLLCSAESFQTLNTAMSLLHA